MKKTIIIMTICVVAVLLLSQSIVSNAVLCFILLGTLPGTHISVPFWVMMAIYSGFIALIVTDMIDYRFSHLRAAKPTKARKSQMPRRRYSRI